MDPVVGAWVSPNIRFYVFALIFVIFDVEALFRVSLGGSISSAWGLKVLLR
jgi:NADH:ubiquinone oxidoreductase subunit 3 (subunit A)